MIIKKGFLSSSEEVTQLFNKNNKLEAIKSLDGNCFLFFCLFTTLLSVTAKDFYKSVVNILYNKMSDDIFIWIEGIGILQNPPERLIFALNSYLNQQFLDYSDDDNIGPIMLYHTNFFAGHSHIKGALQINIESEKKRKILFGPKYQQTFIKNLIPTYDDNVTVTLNDSYEGYYNNIVTSETNIKIKDLSVFKNNSEYFQRKPRFID